VHAICYSDLLGPRNAGDIDVGDLVGLSIINVDAALENSCSQAKMMELSIFAVRIEQSHKLLVPNVVLRRSNGESCTH
jgi:hypothetical protein